MIQKNKTYRFGIISCFLFLLMVFAIIGSHYVSSLYQASLMMFVLIIVQSRLGFYRDLSLPSCLFSIFFMAFILIGVLLENLLRGFSQITFQAIIYSSCSFTFFLYIFKRNIHVDKRSRPSLIDNEQTLALMSILIATLGIGCGLVFFLKVGHIPLLSNASPEARIASMQGNGHLLQPLRSAPIAAIACALGTKYRVLGFSLFITSNLLFLGTGFRGYFIQNILYFMILLFLIRGRRFTFFYSIISGIILIILIFFLGLFRGDGAIINSIFMKIAHAFSVSIYILEIILVHFDDHKFGTTFFYKFTSILPVSNIEYSQWLTAQLPIQFAGGVTPTLIGDFYINFGPLFYLAFLPLAWMLALFDKKIIAAHRLTSLMMITMLAMGVARSATGGLSNTLFQTVLLCFIIYTLSLSGRIKNKDRKNFYASIQ